MPEIKNTFLSSKMNKDLDARIVPNGEYRDAVNVAISRSEDADVGALENVIGNNIISNIKQTIIPLEPVDSGDAQVKLDNLEIIGYYMDILNDRIYIFLTDYTDSSNDKLSNFATGDVLDNSGNLLAKGAACYIVSYNTQTNIIDVLVAGNFLNFSKTHPVLSVSLLEDLLFFTDNRNQPRKINVKRAVAQPWKGGSGTASTAYYYNEDQISVSKYAPWKALDVSMLDVTSATLPDGTANPNLDTTFVGDENVLKDKFIRFSYRFKFDDGEYSIMAPFTQSCFIPDQDGYFLDANDDDEETLKSGIVSFFENKVDKINFTIQLPYNNALLRSRLKVEEIQIVSKATDELAIRVIEDIPISDISAAPSGFTYTYTYNSTKPFQTLPENELTRVHDRVPIRALAQEVVSNRVLYANYLNKHSSPENLSYQVGVVEKPISNNYALSKEYQNHTLKQNRSYQVGIVLVDRYGRASNVIPAKEATQTTFGGNNYGDSTVYSPYTGASLDIVNYFGSCLSVLFNEVIPDAIDTPGYPGLYSATNPLGYYSYKVVVKQQEQDYYNVYTPGCLAGEITWAPKNTVDPSSSPPLTYSSSLPTYPNTDTFCNISLQGDNINKVPRDLQEVNANDVEFSSSVILYNRVKNTVDSSSGTSIYYNAQNNANQTGIEITSIQPFKNLGRWTITKGNMFPDQSSLASANRSPRPYYPFYKSQSNANNFNFHDIFFNATKNPFIATLKTEYSLGLKPIYNNVDTDVIRESDLKRAYKNLAVFETNPIISNLDIYYETSTSGVIQSEAGLTGLNNEVTSPSGSAQLFQFSNINFSNFSEDKASGQEITNYFEVLNDSYVAFNPANTQIALNISQVLDGNNNDRTSDFAIEQNTGVNDNQYRLKTNNTFYYGTGANNRESFTFIIEAIATGNTEGTNLISFQGSLSNVAPIWQNQPPTAVNPPYSSGPNNSFLLHTIAEGDVFNGAISSSDRTKELSYMVDVIGSPQYLNLFEVVHSGTDFLILANLQGQDLTIIPNTLNLRINATDGGAATTPSNIMTFTIT